MSLTQKQESFCLAYIELGNASEAYRRAYNASKMKPNTVEKRACELMKDRKVTGRIAELRVRVVEKVVLDRAWVIERLMRNARIAMGEERIKVAIRPKSAPDTVVELEITERDAAAANRALELLGKADEVGLFKENAAKNQVQPSEPPRSPDPDYVDPITLRYRNALRAIEGGTLPAAREDHMAEICNPYLRGRTAAPAAKPSSQPASSDSDAKLNAAAAQWAASNRRDN